MCERILTYCQGRPGYIACSIAAEKNNTICNLFGVGKTAHRRFVNARLELHNT
jgi:hypothetical protein